MRSVNFFIIDRCRVTFRDKEVETCPMPPPTAGRAVTAGVGLRRSSRKKCAALPKEIGSGRRCRRARRRAMKSKLTFGDTSVQIYYFFLKRFARSQAFVHRRALHPHSWAQTAFPRAVAPHRRGASPDTSPIVRRQRGFLQKSRQEKEKTQEVFGKTRLVFPKTSCVLHNRCRRVSSTQGTKRTCTVLTKRNT